MKSFFKKKSIVAIGICLALVATFSAGAFAATNLEKIQAYKNHGISFKVDGKSWTPTSDDGKPLTAITFEDRTYVPLRAGFETAGFNVKWDDANQQVILTSPGNEIPVGNTGETPTPTPTPTPVSTPTEKVVLKVDTYTNLFNTSLASSGLDSKFAIDATKITKDSPTPDSTNYMFNYSDPASPADFYIMMAGTHTTTGEIANLSFTIHDASANVKQLAVNILTAYVQDATLGKKLYDSAGLSKIIDAAIASGSQAPTTFTDSGYIIRYIYYGQGQNHVVAISKQ
jgi:hypothetical protein